MKVSEFYKLIEARDPHLRKGQAAYNLAYEIAPAGYGQIISEMAGSEIDPFYNDTKLGAFIARLVELGVLEY